MSRGVGEEKRVEELKSLVGKKRKNEKSRELAGGSAGEEKRRRGATSGTAGSRPGEKKNWVQSSSEVNLEIVLFCFFFLFAHKFHKLVHIVFF
jgi:hypothetical protein